MFTVIILLPLNDTIMQTFIIKTNLSEFRVQAINRQAAFERVNYILNAQAIYLSAPERLINVKPVKVR